MKVQVKADLMLLLVTAFWGISYILVDYCLEEMGSITLNAVRFTVAFVVAVVCAFPKLKAVTKETLKYSAIIGVALVAVYISVTYGVMYTRVSNAGFICALSTIITPIIMFFTKGEKPDKKLVVVLTMCFIGIAMLTLNEELKPAFGDILCAITAVAYAIDLVITDTAVRHEKVNAFHLGVFQLGFTALYLNVLAFIIEKPTIPENPKIIWAAVFLAIFCTGLSFIVQSIAQQYTSATHVGIIFALEPVFSAVLAFLLINDVLTTRAYIGGAVMFISVILMEIDVSKIFKMGKRQSVGEDC